MRRQCWFLRYYRTMISSKQLRLARLAMGWGWLALVCYGSLTPSPPQVDISNFDKVEHFTAYAFPMFWFALLYPGIGRRLTIAGLLVGMGIAIEFLQGMTPYRTYDTLDMLANSTGVAIGWLLVRSQLGTLGERVLRLATKN